jgi:homoserine dehydrogenase
MQQVNLGIIGGGTVGSGVYEALQRNGALMASRLGVGLEITRVAVRDLKKRNAPPKSHAHSSPPIGAKSSAIPISISSPSLWAAPPLPAMWC